MCNSSCLMSSTGTAVSRGSFGKRALPSSLSRPTPSCGGLARAHRSCESGRRRRGAVGAALEGCTRLACAAVITLALLGDNTSARSSLRSDHRSTAAAASAHRRHHRPQAWQLFAPKASPSSASPSSSSSSKRTSILDLRRRARLQTNEAGVAGAGGSAVSPAHMYRVSRGSSSSSGGAQQRQRFGSGGGSGAGGGVEFLQSPRSAELLTVYSSASPAAAAMSSSSSSPSASRATVQQPMPSIAEGIGGAVVAQGEGEFGRPALPVLNEEDLTQLRAGQRVQKQTREGGAGSGSVVVDVRADSDVVMGLLTKYEKYADMIDTVRECQVFPQGDSADTQKVEVTVSRFKLHIRVVMSRLRERNMVQFELDPDCTKAGRAVLREATGFFYVESPPDRPGFSRVWMLAKVNVNRFVPGAVVDYAAGRALPRASTWIKPTCEAAQRKKLRASA